MSVNVTGPALNISDCPIGGIIIWHTDSIPAGWLECVGQTIQSSAYPDLVRVLSGSDIAQSVTLPDMRGIIPAGVGYCSARGTAKNINGSTGLNIGEVIGNKSLSLSITPSHTSNSGTITVPLVKHSHTYTKVTAVHYASDFDRTFNGTAVAGVDTGSANTNEVGGSASATVNFPSHNTITQTLDARPPVYGVRFIIKASA